MKSFYFFFFFLFFFEKIINSNAHCSYFNFQSSALSLNLPMKFMTPFFSNVFNNYDFITMCNENHIINPSSHMLQKFHWRKKMKFLYKQNSCVREQISFICHDFFVFIGFFARISYNFSWDLKKEWSKNLHEYIT